MRFITRLFFLLLLPEFAACVNIFDPEVKDASGQLVVSGMITDLEQQQYVYITRARPVYQTTDHPGVSGANVTIVDDQGLIIPLTEQSTGKYTTTGNVKGIIGRFYHVEIDLEGRHYESEPEQMQKPNEIVSLRASFRETLTLAGTTDVQRNVVAFYVDVENDEAGASKFYKYDWDATYSIEVPFRNTMDSCNGATDNSPYVPVCYVSEYSNRFLNILSMKNHTGPLYPGHLITFAHPNIKFMLRYSLLVKQYSLTAQAFEYWEDVRLLTQSTGSLFDPPPTRIQGNIKSTSHPQESVLGYFMASAVVQRREFFTPAAAPIPLQNFDNCDCRPWRDVCEPSNLPPDFWVPPPAKPFCCDCTRYPNAVAQKPVFWID